MRSAPCAARSRCVMRRMVGAAVRSPARISLSLAASTLAKTSSRTRIGGAPASARARATRCRCPPDSVSPRSPITVCQPSGNAATSSATPAVTKAAPTRSSARPSRPSVTLSRIRREKRNASCGTQASVERSRPRGSVRTSSPPTNTVARGGSHSRASTRPSVDLPVPVGPTTATSSPGRTSKLTSRSTGGRPGYANVSRLNRIDAGSDAASAGGAAVSGGSASASTCWMRSIETRPRRPRARVKPSATVGQARYAR